MAKSKPAKKEESDQEFAKRLSDMMSSAKEKTKKEFKELSNTKDMQEKKEEGKRIGEKIKDLEECHKILEEFKIDPPVENMIHINGMLAFIEYDKKYAKKIEFLKKNYMGFLAARNDESYFTIEFSAFGEVFLKRGGMLIPLPRSSGELPIIIRDGDIIVTRDNSYLMSLGDYQQSDQDEIRLFMFPNSEARISVREATENPSSSFMDPSQIPDAIKRKCKSVVHTLKIRNIELLKGLFQISIDKSQSLANKNANSYIKIPNIEFGGVGETHAGIIDNTAEKMKAQNPKLAAIFAAQAAIQNMNSKKESGTCSNINAYAELSGSSTVIFGTMNKIIAGGKPINLKSIAQPKYTISGGSIYVTNCLKNPDPRVKTIMEGAYAFINYAALLESEKNFLKSEGEVSVEKANENLKLARKIGDKLLIQIAEYKVIAAESEIGREKAQIERFSPEGLKSQKEEAEGMMAAAEETGDKEMIEVAKIQMAQTQKVIRKFSDNPELRNIMEKSAGGKSLTPQERMKLMVDTAEATGSVLTPEEIKDFEQTPDKLRKMKAEVEAKAKKILPPYNSPSESDRMTL